MKKTSTLQAVAFAVVSATASPTLATPSRPSDQTELRQNRGIESSICTLEPDPTIPESKLYTWLEPESDTQAFPVGEEAVRNEAAFTRSVEQLTERIESAIAQFIQTHGKKEGSRMIASFDDCGDSPQLGLNILLGKQTHRNALREILADRLFCFANDNLTLEGTAAIIMAHFRLVQGVGLIAEAKNQRLESI